MVSRLSTVHVSLPDVAIIAAFGIEALVRPVNYELNSLFQSTDQHSHLRDRAPLLPKRRKSQGLLTLQFCTPLQNICLKTGLAADPYTRQRPQHSKQLPCEQKQGWRWRWFPVCIRSDICQVQMLNANMGHALMHSLRLAGPCCWAQVATCSTRRQQAISCQI